MVLSAILARALERPRALSADELATLIALEDPREIASCHAAAFALKRRICGNRVAVRGLIEVGNRCAKNCYYCGIRRENASVRRYRLSVAEIARLAQVNCAMGFASLVLQGGEIESTENTQFITTCLERIAPLDLGVTLSLGEQSEAVYRRWREAGATRYLLRIETSNPERYRALHPADHSFARRKQCLTVLRRLGYQVGTGVMSALPDQTPQDLAADIRFFAEIDADMIGMGPYIPHPQTPLAARDAGYSNAARLRLALNMIAATRLYLHDVNIAATTALQALDAHDGRLAGIRAGANVLMPNVTDVQYRDSYALYAGKPALDETAAEFQDALNRHLASIGEELALHTRGDSPHFFARTAS